MWPESNLESPAFRCGEEVNVREPLSGGAVNAVLAVERADGPAVLKLSAPWSTRPVAETAALAAWGGAGAVRLLAQSDDQRVVLLERVMPGTPADTGDTVAVAALLRGLWQPAAGIPEVIPPVADAVAGRYRWARTFGRRPVAAGRLARAEQAALALAATEPSGDRCLLHGDPLVKNVLHGPGSRLVSIDPCPAAGDPCYDLALWALTTQPVRLAADRCVILADRTGRDANRIWEWCLALAPTEVCLAPGPRSVETVALLDANPTPWWKPGRVAAVENKAGSGA